jgi:branched-chain amino acid transport system substrate-binding protein
MNKITSILCQFLFLVFMAVPCWAQKTPLKIGTILTLTGQWAAEGAAFREGIELAIDDINATEKFQISVVHENSEFIPQKSVTAFKKLSTQDVVDVVLFGTLGETKPNIKSIEQAKIPAIVIWDSTPELDEAGEYTFGIGPWAPASGEYAANYAATKLGLKHFAIFKSASEWPEYVGNFFAERIKQDANNTINFYSFLPDQSDFRASLTQAKAKGVQAIYFPLDYFLPTFLKQAKQVAPEITLITSDILSENAISESGSAAEGVYVTMMNSPESAAKTAMLNKYQLKFGKPCQISQFVGWGYDSVMLAVEALSKDLSSATAREKIKNGMYQIKDYNAISGKISITAGGSWPQMPKMFRVKDGKIGLEE